MTPSSPNPHSAGGAPPAIFLEGVRLERGGLPVLGEVTFRVPRGGITAVLGPSGSGKSTLLAALTGMLRPTTGTLTVLSEDISGLSASGLRLLRRQMGVLLQGNGLLTDLTAAENVALPLQVHSGLPAEIIQVVVGLKLNAVGLRAAADKYPRELSGGMARRVALARALALDPPLMIYDEPLTGLDPIAGGIIISLIRRLNDTLGLTSVIVSHHVRETLRIADQAIIIANGGVIFAGTPAELERSDDALVRQFVRGEADGPIRFDSSTHASWSGA